MSGKCSILAHVRNPKGEIVESRLYNDLLHRTSNNRKLTKEYYAVGTSKTFLDEVSHRAEFDENGEITLDSLQRLSGLQIDSDSIVASLNKDIGAGVMSYDDAIVKAVTFNKSNKYKKSFMATLKPTSDGKYRLEVVKRSGAEEVAFNEVIATQTIQNRLKAQLAKHGVSVKFMEKDEKVRGRYSTVNAKRTADGLYQLIEISSNGPNVDRTLAEEAGHFAVGALGESPLVKRLMGLLTPEVQKEILGEEAETKYSDSAREAAGVAVGKALINRLEHKTPWQNLCHRIASVAKKIFATIKGDNVMKAKLEAEAIARDIAAGFMSEDFEGSVENALSFRETLYDADVSFNVRTFRNVMRTLRNQAKQMGAISEDLFKKFDNIASQVEVGKNVDPTTVMADTIALDGMTEAILLITDLLNHEIPKMLEEVNFDDTTDFYNSMPRNGKNLRAVRNFVKYSLEVVEIIQQAYASAGDSDILSGTIGHTTDANGNPVSYNLHDIATNLRHMIDGGGARGLRVTLATKEREFFTKFLEQSYGKNYIERSARVLFKPKRETVLDENGNPVYKRNKDGSLKLDSNGNPIVKTRQRILNFAKSEEVEIKELLLHLESDISFYERFLASMSNSSDIIAQICDKVTKHANIEADKLTQRDWEDLRVLESRYEALKKMGLISDKRDFYEVDNDGKLTGNIRSEYKIGVWERAYHEFKEQAKEEFRRTHNLEGKSDFEIGMLFDAFFKPKAKIWHDHNSLFVVDQYGNGKRIPNHKYKDSSWDSLDPKVQKLIFDIHNYKSEIDRRLGDLHTTSHRAPQLRGTFIDRVRNKTQEASVIGALTSKTLSSFRDMFCETSVDTDYGSNATYSDTSEQLVPNKLAMETETVNRVPMYGINRLPDMTELSTDIFGSLLAYTDMANRYAAISTIADVMEVGGTVMGTQREVEGKKERAEAPSKAFTRFTKFLDKQIYGINVKKIKGPWNFVVDKFINVINGIASTLYLGGNVHGGLVNLGTGTLETFKEAFSGEHFDISNLIKANGVYLSRLPAYLVQMGEEIKEDKINLFVRRFDVLNDNSVEFRNWNTRRPWLINFFGRSFHLPYKSGEHYMHTVPYVALAMNTKIYDANGKETTLWDAFEVEDIAGVSGKHGFQTMKKGKSLTMGNKIYFKDPSSIETFKMIEDLIRQIDTVLNPDPNNIFGGGGLNLSPEQLQYIQDKGYNLADLSNTKTKLIQDKDALIWDSDDDIAFKTKAQEICIRMHGIYNSADHTGLHQMLAGKALLAMRGYALGMIERRFGSAKYNVATGTETGGSLSDAGKMLLYAVTGKTNFLLTARAMLLPFGKGTKNAMLKAGFSAHQFHNMRRNLGDFAVIAGLSLLKMALARPDDEDEEEQSWWDAVGYYFSSRIYKEQLAFNTIRGVRTEYDSLLSLTPIGFQALWDLGDLFLTAVGSSSVEPSDNRLTGDDLPENYTKYYYNSKKTYSYDGEEGVKYTYGDSKAWDRTLRLLPYVKTWQAMEDPYGAYESYEYGQKVKTK